MGIPISWTTRNASLYLGKLALAMVQKVITGPNVRIARDRHLKDGEIRILGLSEEPVCPSKLSCLPWNIRPLGC